MEDGGLDDIFQDLVTTAKTKEDARSYANDPDFQPLDEDEIELVNTDSAEDEIEMKLQQVIGSLEQVNLSLGMRYDGAQNIGGRPYMEDRMYADGNLSGKCGH